MKETYQFFYPCGKPMANVREFIEYYNACYFTDCADKVPYETYTRGKRSVGKNSKFVENLIEKILKKDPRYFTDSDIALILAWKMGKITHTQSQDKLILHGDWKEVLGDYSNEDGFSTWNGEPIKRYGEKSNVTLDIKKIADYLCKNISELNDLVGENSIQAALDKLIKENWQCIGPVYLITLLYFISNNQHPGVCQIYDRFAMRALLAIKNNILINNTVECGELPDKRCKKCSQIVTERMKKYACLLKDIFGDEYKCNRDIDRALWVYGHLFKDSATGKVTC